MTDSELKELQDKERRARNLNESIELLAVIDFEFGAGSHVFSIDGGIGISSIRFRAGEKLALNDNEKARIEAVVKDIVSERLAAARSEFAAL